MVRRFFMFLRRFNNGVPTRREVRYLIEKDEFNDRNKNIRLSGVLYCMGFTLEEIGATQNTTRERIRQHIMKGCRKPSAR